MFNKIVEVALEDERWNLYTIRNIFTAIIKITKKFFFNK